VDCIFFLGVGGEGAGWLGNKCIIKMYKNVQAAAEFLAIRGPGLILYADLAIRSYLFLRRISNNPISR